MQQLQKTTIGDTVNVRLGGKTDARLGGGPLDLQATLLLRSAGRDFAHRPMTSGLHIDGHRADLVILKAARAHAAWMKRTHLENSDILLAAELALPHRLKRGPFADAQMSMNALAEKLEQLTS